MIDLREKGLPNTIKVDGKSFFINTDFRAWIKFGEIIKKDTSNIADLLYLFKGDFPRSEFLQELLEFYLSKEVTPISKNEDNTDEVILLDWIKDGSYIVGSFYAEYGINLTECDMHWHLFKALFLSLSDKSKIKDIMSIRGYKNDNEKYENKMKKAKEAWTLIDEKELKERHELLEWFNNL